MTADDLRALLPVLNRIHEAWDDSEDVGMTWSVAEQLRTIANDRADGAAYIYIDDGYKVCDVRPPDPDS